MEMQTNQPIDGLDEKIRGLNLNLPLVPNQETKPRVQTISDGFDPMLAKGRSGAEDLQGAGAPSTNTQSAPKSVVDTKEKKPSSLDMQSELAAIQALSKGFQGNNIGAAVGTGVGAAAGSIIGPVGTVAGSAIGGGIGAIVDYMMDSSAKERIARKQADLKRKLIRKQQRKNNANAIAERKARLKGIGLSLQEEAMTAEQAIKNERKATLANLMYDIGQKSSFRNQMNTNFKAQRGLV